MPKKKAPPVPVTPDLVLDARGFLMADKLDPLLRRATVIEVTGLSNSQMYREIRDGRFPRPRQLTTGTVGWLLSDIAAWIRSRPEAEGV